MDTRPPPFQAHSRAPSRPHDHPQYSVPPSPYGDAPRNIPPPPPPPPPPAMMQQDPFYRPQRQTFESIAASTPRPDARPAAASYPPPPPPYSGSADAFPRDPRDAPMERREGLGMKRSHDQAMAGEHVENGRPDSRRIHYDHPGAAVGHQHPSAPAPFHSNDPTHATGAPPSHSQNPHATERSQKLGNGTMYQASTSRSTPPPPSPYGGRPMLPPNSPQYGQPQYGPHGPHGPQQGPLPPPHFARDLGASHHRAGMSITSILGGEPPRQAHESPRFPPMNGGPPNGQSYYGERDQRGGPQYMDQELRSQTPDRYVPRQFEYTRPSRAISDGERSLQRPDRAPEKFGFGPPLPHGHELKIDQRGPQPIPPHNSAPGSRRQSVGGALPSSLNRPQTSVGPAVPEQFHPLAHLPMDLFNSHRDPRDMHREAHRPPPPPMPSVEEYRNGSHAHSPDDRRYWEQDPGRPPYREETGPASKPPNYPMMPALQDTQLPPRVHDIDRAPDSPAQPLNGNGPLYGPATKPPTWASETEKRGNLDDRKSSIDSIPTYVQARLESPVLKHKHVGMDRTNSTRSEYTPSRSFLHVSAEERRNRAQSPLPQAVQGAQAPSRGPTSEPGIKGEFGRMFSGLGGVTPTRTPAELHRDGLPSPASEAPGGRNTPGLSRFDSGAKRANSHTGKRKKNKDDGFEGDLGSPTGDGNRPLNGKALKRSRNSYIEGLGIHRGDSGSPFGAARRAFTPTSFGHHPKREHKPRTIVRSQAVLDSVKSQPRKHLGSILYQVHVESASSIAAYPESGKLGTEKYGFDAAPYSIPKFEDKANCTFTVRVPREYLTKAARIEVCERRNLWGTEVYTDDSDPLAAAIHSGWIRGEWPADIDVSMLSIGKEKEREARLNSNAIGPNGRTSLSVSVSPELSRKSLAPYTQGNAVGNTSGSERGGSRPNSEVGSGAGGDKKADAQTLTSVPSYPVVPGPGKDLHITLLLLPRLQKYASTIQNGIKSRPWTTQHDGNSFMVHEIQVVDDGSAGRRDERSAGAKHTRLRGRTLQPKGPKKKLSNLSRALTEHKTVVAAVGA